MFADTSPEMKSFLNKLMHNFFKQTVDTLSFMWDEDYDYLRKSFFSLPWYAVYDFIEFVTNNYPVATIRDNFIKTCNDVLESEQSAYRFVGGQITQITSKGEISEIEEALETPFKTVSAHLENALKLMSDKKSPDYRNSIKESISSVEAICRLITKKKNATLGDALDIIEKEGKIELHGALKRAFDSLYGYTSSAEGIRHALTEEKVKVDFEDAKFMLVSCSAFVNYLTSKVSKAGMKIG